MLVSVEEMSAYLNNRQLTYELDERAEGILSETQSELELYCNRLFEVAQVSEVITSDLTGVLPTRFAPVWKVIELTSLQQAALVPSILHLNDYTPTPMQRDSLLGEDGKLLETIKSAIEHPGHPVAGGVSVGVADATFVVRYVTGYTGMFIPAVKSAIKRVAARILTAQVDDTLSLRQDQTSMAAQIDDRPIGWSEDELKQFDRLRRRNVV